MNRMLVSVSEARRLIHYVPTWSDERLLAIRDDLKGTTNPGDMKFLDAVNKELTKRNDDDTED